MAITTDAPRPRPTKGVIQDDEYEMNHVLGMPHGSIRAILTMMIVSVVVYQLAHGVDVPLLWSETLMIALAHYFTSRRFIKLPRDVIQRLSKEGHVEAEHNPLWLPHHSIRAILVLTFLGVAVYLYRCNHLWEVRSLSILGVVFAYFLGLLLPNMQNRRLDNLKALVVLTVMGITTGFFFMDAGDSLPLFMRNLSLGLVLFYFGSR